MNTRVSQLYGVGLDVEVQRINMRYQMTIQKRTDGLTLRNLIACCQAVDSANTGVLDRDGFEKALGKYG